MVVKMFLVIFLSLSYVTLVFSHGVGGGSLSTTEPKKYKKPTPDSSVNRIKPFAERFTFSLEIDKNTAKLWIITDLNNPADTSLASATVIIHDAGSPVLFKMMPTEEGHIIGTIPVKMTNNTKFHVVLRMPGGRPINLSFTPGQSDKPTNVSQQASH